MHTPPAREPRCPSAPPFKVLKGLVARQTWLFVSPPQLGSKCLARPYSAVYRRTSLSGRITITTSDLMDR